MVPLTVVPGGTVTGTLTEPVAVLAMLTTPLVSLAVTVGVVAGVAGARTEDHAVWSARVLPMPPRVSCT